MTTKLVLVPELEPAPDERQVPTGDLQFVAPTRDRQRYFRSRLRAAKNDELGAITAEYAVVIIRRPLAPTEFRVTQDPRSPAVPLQHQRGSERRINTPHGR